MVVDEKTSPPVSTPPCVILASPASLLVGAVLVVVSTLAFAGVLPYASKPVEDFVRSHKAATLNKCVLVSPRCWSFVFGAS